VDNIIAYLEGKGTLRPENAAAAQAQPQAGETTVTKQLTDEEFDQFVDQHAAYFINLYDNVKLELIKKGYDMSKYPEINAFLDNPFFGVGVAKGTEIRLAETGQVIASHNEITRMLGEHGFFGLLGLVLLVLTPSILFLGNRQHVYAFCFVAFWLLTINHAAMRTAAPSFIYALSLLKVYLIDPNEITLHREQTV
jgi:hypothetical protein